MLVLSRRVGQALCIGEDIQVVVLGFDGDSVRIGIRAPAEVRILRRELLTRLSQTEDTVSKPAV
jgi:carbon storage regulator